MKCIDAERMKRKKVVSDKPREKSPRKRRTGESSSSRVRTPNWTHNMDSNLLTIMKQEYLQGNFVNGQFNRDSWATIVSSFNAKTNLSFNREHLRNRLKVLKNVFRPYNELEIINGWSWDSDLNLPKPENPDMWDRVIAMNPQYAKCREKTCPEYPILKLFFTKNITNQTQIDALAVELTDKEQNSSSSLKIPEKNTPSYNYYQNTPLQTNNYEEPEPENDTNSDMASEKSESITKALEELSQLNKRQQEIIQFLMGQDVFIGPKAHSTEQCIAKLKTVRNLSPDVFLRACEAFRDKHERQVFMSLNGKTLNAWIQLQCKAQPGFGNPGNHFRIVSHSQEVDFP